MTNFKCAVILAFMAFTVVSGQYAESFKMCKRKSIFGTKTYFSCPEPGQPSDMVFCCGDDDDFGGQFCCRGIGIDGIGSIIATIAGVLGFLIILFIICCCVCPCCLLYKRRTSGNVYRSTVPTTTAPSGVNVTVVPAPVMQSGPPPVGFTTQVAGSQGPGYPLQPNYPPQPTYPPQPGYPAAAPYPPYPQQGGYGGPNVPHPGYPQPGYPSDLPPPYPGTQEAYQKQSPYNPGY